MEEEGCAGIGVGSVSATGVGSKYAGFRQPFIGWPMDSIVAACTRRKFLVNVSFVSTQHLAHTERRPRYVQL